MLINIFNWCGRLEGEIGFDHQFWDSMERGEGVGGCNARKVKFRAHQIAPEAIESKTELKTRKSFDGIHHHPQSQSLRLGSEEKKHLNCI